MIHHEPGDPASPHRRNWNDDFRLEIFVRADGDWGWHPVSRHNGQILAPEGYRNKGEMLELLGRLFPEATPAELPRRGTREADLSDLQPYDPLDDPKECPDGD